MAAVLLATPALAVRSETGYAVLYRIAPAVAQFFQPIQEACTDSGITMEVAAVRVEGDTAQAYIVLSGGPVDATTDLFDSWSFHLPFDQTGRCERVAWDEATGTVTFLCTVKTMDGSPIPTGGKMTFSVRQLLTGKKAMEGVTVDLKLTNYAQEAETALTWGADPPAAGVREPEVTYYSATGGSGDLASVMLQPGEVWRSRGGPAHHSRRLRRRPLPHPAVPGRRLQDGQPRVFVDGRCRRQGIPLYRYLLFYR